MSKNKFILALKQIWKYVVLLPFNLVDYLVENLANTFRSSLSFRIAMSYVILTVLMVVGFSIFLYFGFIAIFNINEAGYVMLTKKELMKTALWVFFASFFIGAIMLSIGKKISDKLLSPIVRMKDEIMQISSEDMSQRLDEESSKDELRELAARFNAMMDDIEKSYKRKAEFVSDASHELRTPISVVSGYANMLKRWGKNDPEILDEAIDALISEADQMKGLVEKLLFLARSDKGKIQVNKSPVDALEVLRDIENELTVVGLDRVVELDVTGSHFDIMADPEMFKQLLRIFIDNAIKFSDAGSKISLRAVSDDRELVRLTIGDEGIGISEEDLPRIFKRFYRAEKSRNSDRGGNGLGLSIARLIITSHGAKVHIDSQLGRGTEVTLTFRLNRSMALAKEELEGRVGKKI